MFPLAILIAKVIKAAWNTNDNPLGILGLYLNLTQIMYFPILFWTFSKSPGYMIIFFAVITGAHFFPYGWFYNTKAYMVMAPVISAFITIFGWNIASTSLWKIPLLMIVLLIILSVWIYIDYRQKIKNIS